VPSFSPDRVAGVLLGQAAGDALGAGYEFTTPPPDAPIRMKGGGSFRWEPGEWTDDTQMAICVAESVSTGSLDPVEVARQFLDWYAGHPRDVGHQTSCALSRAKRPEDLAAKARECHMENPDAAGNGSLMRTGPVALAYLGKPDRVAEAAREISSLTHAHPRCGDACVLWCLAIDRAVSEGVFELAAGLEWLPEERRDFWAERIREAETLPPSGFKPNGYVVTALQAAWAAITQTPVPEDEPSRYLPDALVAAVRIGDDTDTVAAIAGALLGARWGASAVPEGWTYALHGWPGYKASDLARLALRAAGLGGTEQASPQPPRREGTPHGR
jgi:ADP-ribosyl-[dinitrogen reductase] hydrolase